VQPRATTLSVPVWAPLALAAALLVGYLVLFSLQLAGAVAVVVLVAGLYARAPAAGMVALWTTWLVLPGIRRLFGYADGYVSADPLAVAPFVATACVAVLELTQTRLSERARRIMLLAAGGFAVGLPVGLAASPTGAVYALFAYTAAVGAFVLGYRERGPLRDTSLYRALLVAVPLLGAYSVVQYFSIPVWDAAWLEDVGFVTAGAPEEGRARVFATLNSPGTFAPVLAIAIVAFLATRRIAAPQLAALALGGTALALTYVRGAWIALAAAMIALAIASRGRASARVGVVVVIIAVAIPALAAGGGTAGAIVGRFDTLGRLDQDTSAQARIDTPSRLVPQLAREPLGAGLGRAGEATRLDGTGGLRAPDNAYLSLLLQLGPFGALLVLAALFTAARAAFASAARRASWTGAALVALVVYFAVHMFATDLLYGITGVVLWFLLGFAVRRSEEPPGGVTAPAPRGG